MTENSVKNIVEALEIISGECKKSNCEGDCKCPLFSLCNDDDVNLFELKPRDWAFPKRT